MPNSSVSTSGKTPAWRVALRRCVEEVQDFVWSVFHPSMRRCPECRLTWEGRDHMHRYGKCHDCISQEDDG